MNARLGLQMDYDLEVAQDELAEQIVHDVRVLAAPTTGTVAAWIVRKKRAT